MNSTPRHGWRDNLPSLAMKPRYVAVFVLVLMSSLCVGQSTSAARKNANDAALSTESVTIQGVELRLGMEEDHVISALRNAKIKLVTNTHDPHHSTQLEGKTSAPSGNLNFRVHMGETGVLAFTNGKLTSIHRVWKPDRNDAISFARGLYEALLELKFFDRVWAPLKTDDMSSAEGSYGTLLKLIGKGTICHMSTVERQAPPMNTVEQQDQAVNIRRIFLGCEPGKIVVGVRINMIRDVKNQWVSVEESLEADE